MKDCSFNYSESLLFRQCRIHQLSFAGYNRVDGGDVLTKKQHKEMADRIKHRRESLGFTQEGFCEAIDLSASSYTKIENAFQKPALNTLIKIAQHLDLSLDYLVFGDDEGRLQKPINMDIINVILKNADKDKMRYALDIFARIADETEKQG